LRESRLPLFGPNVSVNKARTVRGAIGDMIPDGETE